MNTINLECKSLFRSEIERLKFIVKLKSFVASDPDFESIINIDYDSLRLEYPSNELLCEQPEKDKVNLILVFGNPAPHSIKEKIMFSYEGNTLKIHRVWKVLQKTRIIAFPAFLMNQNRDNYHDFGVIRNDLVRQGLASSRFNLSMFSYFTLPSPSSDDRWSGVAGLKKLFGTHAWKQIEAMENERFMKLIVPIPKDAKFLVFQRDAYQSIVTNNPNLDVTLLPPTRLWFSKLNIDFLTNLAGKPNHLDLQY
jgi:hypothetical protein